MGLEGAATDVTGDELETAVNAAIRRERPLLIKGEPGTGKTLLAEEIADSHYPGVKPRLLEQALKASFAARETPGLKKKPSTSELLDWLKLLLSDDVAAESLREQDPRKPIPPLRGALPKNEQDVRLFEPLAFLDRRERR